MEDPVVIVAVETRASDNAIKQASHVASWIGKLGADAYILFITDSRLVKNASLADDEYFNVAERKKFITEGIIEKGKVVIEELKGVFKKYGIYCFEKVVIGDPIREVSRTANETNAIGVISFGIDIPKLIKKCSAPVVIMPKEDSKGFTDIIKEKISIMMPFSHILAK